MAAEDCPHRPRRLNIDHELIERATAVAAQITGERPTFRVLVRLALERELAQVVGLLSDAGLVNRPGDKPRPRPIDDRDWEALGEAERQVALGRVELIRACLERLARGEDKQ